MLLADHILFCDGEAIIVDKPAGLPVTVPRSGILSVENYLDSLRFGFERLPTIVHRLDQDTSGCLLLARNPKAHKRFAQAFENGLVKKTYWAVLDGIPDGNSGTIDMPLDKVSSEEDGWRIIASPAGKRAVSHWRIVDQQHGRALVEFQPETGRTHQLRVHAASGLGHAIIGDPVYCDGGSGLSGGKTPMLLHAARIEIPRDGKPPVIAEAHLPARFIAAGFASESVAPESAHG